MKTLENLTDEDLDLKLQFHLLLRAVRLPNTRENSRLWEVFKPLICDGGNKQFKLTTVICRACGKTFSLGSPIYSKEIFPIGITCCGGDPFKRLAAHLPGDLNSFSPAKVHLLFQTITELSELSELREIST